MKPTPLATALLGALVAAPLWAHHAAEGIISDDIWLIIDQNLVEADSEHLDFDPDNPGNTMDLDVDETGRAGIASTGIVEFTDDFTAAEATFIMDTEFAEVFDTTIRGVGGIPTGMTDLEYELVVDQDGIVQYANVYLFEPIGQGNSQDLPTTPAPEPPGKRAGG